MKEKELTLAEQREVTFYDDQLTAVRADDQHVYVVLSHMCEALQIDTQGQARRIGRHSVLAKGLSWIDILSTQGQHTQRRRARVLRVDLVPLWLSGIRTSMVGEAIRPKLERFQEQAAATLWEAFQEGRLTADPTFDELLLADSPAAQAYKMASAIMQMARQQLLLESELKNQASQLADHEKRLEQVEATLSDTGQHVTPDQAMQISQAVKTIAMVLSKATGTNQYGSVYGQLYRKFGITSYKLLPASRFEEAMEFLTEWHQNLVGDVPF